MTFQPDVSQKLGTGKRVGMCICVYVGRQNVPNGNRGELQTGAHRDEPRRAPRATVWEGRVSCVCV